MNEIARIATHLRGRPIAEIFEECSEENNIFALKFLCILDFELSRLGLYTKINAIKLTHPKTLKLLMRFHTFASFNYYDYAVKKKAIGSRILQCKFCPLVAPYAFILTHMAINHNAHIGMKMCVYCNSVELEQHFADNTLEQCYQNYMQKIDGHDFEWNDNVSEIVLNFFGMLKKLSKKFGICSFRRKQFKGHGYGYVEQLNQNYGDDFPNKCTVFKQHVKETDFSTSNAFETEFQRVMTHFYGQHDNIRLNRRQQRNSVLIIDEPCDEQEQNIPMEQLQSMPNDGNRLHVNVEFIAFGCLMFALFSSSPFTV